jgi:hypothetical protein
MELHELHDGRQMEVLSMCEELRARRLLGPRPKNNIELRKELEARGLDAEGKRTALEARLEAAIVADEGGKKLEVKGAVAVKKAECNEFLHLVAKEGRHTHYGDRYVTWHTQYMVLNHKDESLYLCDEGREAAPDKVILDEIPFSQLTSVELQDGARFDVHTSLGGSFAFRVFRPESEWVPQSQWDSYRPDPDHDKATEWVHAIQAVVPKSAAPGAAASLIAPATPIPARVQQVLAEKDQHIAALQASLEALEGRELDWLKKPPTDLWTDCNGHLTNHCESGHFSPSCSCRSNQYEGNPCVVCECQVCWQCQARSPDFDRHGETVGRWKHRDDCVAFEPSNRVDVLCHECCDCGGDDQLHTSLFGAAVDKVLGQVHHYSELQLGWAAAVTMDDLLASLLMRITETAERTLAFGAAQVTAAASQPAVAAGGAGSSSSDGDGDDDDAAVRSMQCASCSKASSGSMPCASARRQSPSSRSRHPRRSSNSRSPTFARSSRRAGWTPRATWAKRARRGGTCAAPSSRLAWRRPALRPKSRGRTTPVELSTSGSPSHALRAMHTCTWNAWSRSALAPALPAMPSRHPRWASWWRASLARQSATTWPAAWRSRSSTSPPWFSSSPATPRGMAVPTRSGTRAC